ncbi:hypothetical protein KFJ24_00695 [Marinobacter sediminum]|uniref:hypothetical protein n=1 Tax=Marinobacter sediminum TaxID=256323 RepID=UPI00202E2195|nr:hypothetical protein [Marinobacter sediminum]MCM0610992.1 hypothetical protein [Marinobacter sediminum]
MNLKRFLYVFIACVAMNLVPVLVQADESRSMLDGNLLAAEAGRVDLVVNSSGEVVQVLVEECEQCDRASYLPSPDLSVMQAGNPAFSGEPSGVNEQAGTVVLNRKSGMVVKVIFWMPRGRESEK